MQDLNAKCALCKKKAMYEINDNNHFISICYDCFWDNDYFWAKIVKFIMPITHKEILSKDHWLFSKRLNCNGLLTLKTLKRINRVPKWADTKAILRFYLNRPHKNHIHHIIPLESKLVSGLHVHNNLKYVTIQEHWRIHAKLRKQTIFEPI